MAKKSFHFRVNSRRPPSVELDDAGLYVRFQSGMKAAQTVVRSDWPHVAIDVAADGSIIGIECVPTPNRFSIAGIAKKAGLNLPTRFSGGNLEITRRHSEPALASA